MVEISTIPFYLRKALKTKLLKYFSRQAKHIQFNVHHEYSQCVESVEEEVVAKEWMTQQNSRLAQQISLLPKRQQQALHLRFYENLSYDEIAKLMALTRHSVYNLIFQSISQLLDNVAFSVAMLWTANYFF